MHRSFFIVFSFLILVSTNVFAQDTVKVNNKTYVFNSNINDTIKADNAIIYIVKIDTAKSVNGNSYIIKHVVVPEMAYVMRGNGKIYVVVTVLATIFVGIFVFLVLLDRKISKLEKEKTT